MAALKCPNSTCSFLFDPDKVPAGALLACPRCQTKFRVADAQAPVAPGPVFDSERAERNPEVETTQSLIVKWLPWIGIGLALAIGIGALAAAVSAYRAKQNASGGAEEQYFTDHNAGIRAPIEPWERDRDLENQLAVNLGLYTRPEPAAWIAYAAQKYDTRNARTSELDTFLNERLRKLCDNLQIEPKDGVTWLGQPALAKEFRGTTKRQTVVVGEAIGVSIAGVAYYFFAWAPEKDWATAESEITAAKQRIRVMGRRENWKETVSLSKSFAGKKARYSVVDGESIWKEPTNRSAADQDPLCDLYLEAEIQPKGKRLDIRPRAELLAYRLPAGPDLMRVATEYVSKRMSRNPELYQEFVVDVVKEEIAGDEPLGAPPGEPIAVTRYKLSHPKSPDVAKLIVVAAIEVNGDVIAVETVCPWDQRVMWEKRLVNLAGSLRKADAPR